MKKEEYAHCSDEKVSINPPQSSNHVIVDHLCCKICYEPYSEIGEREPKVLKCGHSVCFQCLNHIHKKTNGILCPFCKYFSQVRPHTLPKNYDIVLMLSHYPQLPPNQKLYNLEFEKTKSQWAQEQDIVNQLHLRADESRGLVRQAEVQLENLRKYAESVNNDFIRAKERLKVAEDTLRLFVDLHPNEPEMVSLAEKLGEGKKMTLLESIRLAKEERPRHGSKNASGRTSFLDEIRTFHSSSTHAGPPPPPPRHHIATSSSSNVGSVHNNQRIAHSPREQMLLAIRGGR